MIWREGAVRLKLEVQGQGSGRTLDVYGQEGWGVLKTGQFSWKPYVYHPFNYCPLVWTCHSRKLNYKLNRLQERVLRIVYNNKWSTFY